MSATVTLFVRRLTRPRWVWVVAIVVALLVVAFFATVDVWTGSPLTECGSVVSPITGEHGCPTARLTIGIGGTVVAALIALGVFGALRLLRWCFLTMFGPIERTGSPVDSGSGSEEGQEPSIGPAS